MKKIVLLFLAFLSCFSQLMESKSRKKLGKNIIDPHSYHPAPHEETSAKKYREDFASPSRDTLPLAFHQAPVIEKRSIDKEKPVAKETIIPSPPLAAKKERSSSPTPKPSKQNSISGNEIYLNFENADLINFINYIADLRKINIFPDKALAGNKISLTTRTPLTSAQAWNLLHTVLDMSGYCLVKDGSLYKVVPNNQKMIQPLQTFINVSPASLPSSDENIRYVTFLNNVKVGDIKNLLDSILGSPHIAIAQENVNALIISDKSNNIKSAMKIAQELDKNGLQEAVIVIRLKERNATDVEALLKNLIEDKMPNHPLAHLFRRPEQMHSFFGPTKIFSEERSNALVLLGSKDATLTIENFIKEHIDIALKAMDSPLHVYELQYMESKQLVELLKDATANPESTAGQEASKYGAVRGGVKYFKNMTFKADEEGNRIIVSTSDKQDWRLMKQIIKDLDKPQPQVAIETLIVIVDSTDTDKLGGQFRNKKHGMLGSGIDVQTAPLQNTVLQTDAGKTTNLSLLGNLLSGLTGTLGQTILTFGRPQNIWGIFQFLQARTRSSIVAQPFLTITNKFSSEILIGQTNRVPSETAVVNGTQVTGYKDSEANLKISVTPQINIDGIINLKINVAVNDFGDNTNIIFNRNLDTAVSVANGQVLALGGFVQTQVQEMVGKVPVLGDIPVVGWLFKNKQKVVTKNNILIFMCPTIIKPRSTPGINLYTRMKLQQAKQDIRDSLGKPLTIDPVHNWFFNPEKRDYAHKVDDFASARYQPVTVDIQNDEYYRAEKAQKSKNKLLHPQVKTPAKEISHDT